MTAKQPNIQSVLSALPPYVNRYQLVAKKQDSLQIMSEVLRVHGLSAPHYDNVVSVNDFWRGNPHDTAREVFNFVKKSVPYSEEGMYTQTVKHPQAILAEAAKKGGDCKHYASFIVGIVDALRRKGHPITAFYRFCTYQQKHKNSPGHVFAVVIDDNGREIWADPVLKTFNTRHPAYLNNWDKWPEGARIGAIGSLYVVNGVSRADIQDGHEYTMGNRSHWSDDWYRRDGTMGKPKHKAHHKAHHPHKLHAGKFFKKFGEAAPRNAFLGLLKVNFGNLAKQMADKSNNVPGAKDKIDHKWTDMGGNTNKLHTAINQGVNTYNRLHHGNVQHMGGLSSPMYGRRDMYFGESEHIDDGGDMMAGPEIPALLAAAGPILIAFKNILHSLGIDTNKLHEDSDKAGDDLAAKHNKKVEDGEVDDDGNVTHDDGTVTKVTKDKAGNQTLEVKPKGAADDEDDQGSQSDNGKALVPVKKKNTDLATTDSGGGLMAYVHKVTDWVGEHKVAVGIGVGVTVLFLARHKIFHPVKKRR